MRYSVWGQDVAWNPAKRPRMPPLLRQEGGWRGNDRAPIQACTFFAFGILSRDHLPGGLHHMGHRG